MNNKLIITIGIVFLLCLASSQAITTKDYMPSWFESWEGNQTGIVYNFWHSLNPFIPEKNDISPYDDADKYGWYNNTFFGLANWEREVCLFDLTSNVHNTLNRVIDPLTEVANVYTTTVTITATKSYSYNKTFLYEVSWYLMPYDNDASYRVYLANGSSKEYMGSTGEKWVPVTKLIGAAGYDAKYVQNNFDKAVIEYNDTGSEILNEMSVKIVDK